MSRFVDLHLHTYFSDGTDSPQEIVQDALDKGLSAIAVTDHDTVEGIDPTRIAAQGTDLEVISGIELSSETASKDIHILGYFIDHHNWALLEKLQRFRDARFTRALAMIEKLRALGVNNVDWEETLVNVRSQSLGRPHLAALLIEKGWVSNDREAFDRYLAEDAPAYVSKEKQTPAEAIRLIKDAGGLAVLAHPVTNGRDEVIPQLVEDGLDGLEVFYPGTSAPMLEYYKGLACKHGLLMTGGSDAHGRYRSGVLIGQVRVPYEVVEEMKERLL